MRTAGVSDQFDDLIADPNGASTGPEGTTTTTEEKTGEETDDKSGIVDVNDKKSSSEDIETWDNLDPNSQVTQLEDKDDKDEKGEVKNAEKDNKED